MQRKHKTIGIFTPFPQIIGGGERYIFTLAESFSLRGFHVEILSPFQYDLRYMSKVFDLKLKNCIYKKTNSKLFFFPTFKKHYDYFFALSNHIVPPVWGQGRFNSLIIQFPFPFPTTRLGDKVQKLLLAPKLGSYQRILCYSDYSKEWIIKKLPKFILTPEINVIYPPVDTSRFKLGSKKNIILTVGRFFSGDHNKKHNNLIKAFKELIKEDKLKRWEFHLAGYLPNDQISQQYYKTLEKNIKNYPIFLHPNVSNKDLKKLYGHAKILWHATGYRNDESVTPEKSEHFGIVIIEAMSSGAIPIVANQGGTKEIISNNENGFLWKNLHELKKQTLLTIDHTNYYRISTASKSSVAKFDLKKFYGVLNGLYK